MEGSFMKKSFWQSSVFRFWLVCYLLVLGIPMIFSAVAQHRMFEDLKKRTYDQSVSAVEQLAVTPPFYGPGRPR